MVIEFKNKSKDVNFDDFIKEFIETGELNYKLSYYIANKSDVEDLSQSVVTKLLESKIFDRIDYRNGSGSLCRYIGTTIANMIKNYYFKESRWRRLVSSEYLCYTYKDCDDSFMKRVEERCNVPDEFLPYYDELVTGGNVYTTFQDSNKPLYWGYRVRDQLKNIING